MRGYKIRAVRPFTDVSFGRSTLPLGKGPDQRQEMIRDLKTASTQFASENQRRRTAQHEGTPPQASRTPPLASSNTVTEIDYPSSRTRQIMDSQDPYASSSRRATDSPYGAVDPGSYGAGTSSTYPNTYGSATPGYAQGAPPQQAYPSATADRPPYSAYGAEGEYSTYSVNRSGAAAAGYPPPHGYAAAGPPSYGAPVPGPGYDPRYAPPPGRGGPPLEARYYEPIAPAPGYPAGRAYENPNQAGRDPYRQGPPPPGTYSEYGRRR